MDRAPRETTALWEPAVEPLSGRDLSVKEEGGRRPEALPCRRPTHCKRLEITQAHVESVSITTKINKINMKSFFVKREI